MAKTPVEKAKPAEKASTPLTLHEFCARLSEKDRRVSLISGFEYSERSAGRLKDTESAYRARFAEFINKPA